MIRIIVITVIVAALVALAELFKKNDKLKGSSFYLNLVAVIGAVLIGVFSQQHIDAQKPKVWTAEEWHQGLCKIVYIYEWVEGSELAVKVGHKFVDAAILPKSEDDKDNNITLPIPTK